MIKSQFLTGVERCSLSCERAVFKESFHLLNIICNFVQEICKLLIFKFTDDIVFFFFQLPMRAFKQGLNLTFPRFSFYSLRCDFFFVCVQFITDFDQQLPRKYQEKKE